MRWWEREVIYQVYVRSFCDSDGDGVGDLNGIRGRLDHLAWLGVGAIWLTPIHPSPNCDWGYDVADYLGVDSELGTADDLDALVAEASGRGIRVLLDLVPNHTSSRHPWFVEASSSRDSPMRDRYVWADGRGPGVPPNNWLNMVRRPAWTFHPPSGQWYLHNFFADQPDLNWWNPEVRAEFDRIMRFWFDRGIAGFRVDVAHGIVKDARLRDNPPATGCDPERVRAFGQRQHWNTERPEVHDVLRHWRRLADGAGDRLLLGETFILDLPRMAAFYGSDDELHLCHNMVFPFACFSAADLRAVVEATEAVLPDGAWPTWYLSNHDLPRFASRWCADDERRVRCALLMLMCLRGTPALYYGDEIGARDAAVDAEQARDPVAAFFPPGRDPARAPMAWDGSAGRGFTTGGATPWLPFASDSSRSVRAQSEDPASPLHLTRDLIALRRSTPDLLTGGYRTLASPPGTWAWRRGARTLCVLNLAATEAEVDTESGHVLRATEAGVAPAPGTPHRLTLPPWSGAVLGGCRPEVSSSV